MTDFQKQSIDHAAAKLKEAKSKVESLDESLKYNASEQKRHEVEIDKLEVRETELKALREKASRQVTEALGFYQNVCADFAGVNAAPPKPTIASIFGFPVVTSIFE